MFQRKLPSSGRRQYKGKGKFHPITGYEDPDGE